MNYIRRNKGEKETQAMERLISFIVPVFNIEKYLPYCIESILEQTSDQCEIILVDDGSTDNSGKICDDYKQKSKIVTVVHQKNFGLAVARNIGMSYAKGKYIAFVDGDDYIAENCVKKIINWAEKSNADVCFMKAFKTYPDGKQELLDDIIKKERVYEKTKKEIFSYISKQSKFPGSPCTKLFRNEFLKKNDLQFPQDRRISEDLGFVLKSLLLAESIDSCEFDYYYYRQFREGSITNRVTYKSFKGLKLFVEESTNALMIMNKPRGEIEEYAMSFVAYEYAILLWQYTMLKKEEKIKEKDFLKEYKWVVKYARGKTALKVKKAIHILGLNGTALLLKIAMQLREVRIKK